MFLTKNKKVWKLLDIATDLSQSPQIGSMFLTFKGRPKMDEKRIIGRNPLKSGQCFLHGKGYKPQDMTTMFYYVAIPSNRVNVSYHAKEWAGLILGPDEKSQSPQIGSMFLTRR